MRTSTILLLPILLIPIATFGIYSLAKSESKLANPLAVSESTFTPNEEWNKYWYAGEAELNSYKLNQARYGEMHEGTAMLMFVTEDFSTISHTKAGNDKEAKLPVLKMNFEKKFVTGIYPYSMLLTVASPTDVSKHPAPIKIATSSQEWCGHTYTQFNLVGKQFEVEEHSYFPGEGDQKFKLATDLTEDAIWTRLRISPSQLPTGDFMMVPGTFYMRLRHQEIKAKQASAILTDTDLGGMREYKLKYKDGSRELHIKFTAAFPYTIESWTEIYEEGFGPNAKIFTTTASRIKTKKLAYWNLHNNEDRPLRKEMGLE